MVCSKPSLFFAGMTKGLFTGTSKLYAPGTLNSLSTFGFRGEGESPPLVVQIIVLNNVAALASAAELGCLEISSRTGKSRETWSIIMKGGSCLYSGPAIRWRRESSGTAVCVRDAFYNVRSLLESLGLYITQESFLASSSPTLSSLGSADFGIDPPGHRNVGAYIHGCHVYS
jgi:hypothetical protein